MFYSNPLETALLRAVTPCANILIGCGGTLSWECLTPYSSFESCPSLWKIWVEVARIENSSREIVPYLWQNIGLRVTVSSLILNKFRFWWYSSQTALVRLYNPLSWANFSFDGMQRKQLSYDCLIHFLEQSVGSEGMQRKQLSWDLNETVSPLTQSKVLVLMVHCNPFSSQLVFNLTLAPSWV